MNIPKIKPMWIVLGVLAIFALWVGSSYNGLISQNETVDSKWAQVDTQLQRRYDLIPNLVNTVKGNTQQEKDVFGALAAARAQYAGATTPESRTAAANQIEGSLARLLVIVENYPALESSKAFRDLMTEIAGSENRVAIARKDYNDVVAEMNKRVKRFPGNIVAGIFGFSERDYFQVTEEAKTVPVVNFE